MMYIIHSLIVISIWTSAILFTSCSTTPTEVKEHCEYELVPDPSGSAKWRVVCHPIVEEDGGCGCWDEENSDPVGEVIDREIVL